MQGLTAGGPGRLVMAMMEEVTEVMGSIGGMAIMTIMMMTIRGRFVLK